MSSHCAPLEPYPHRSWAHTVTWALRRWRGCQPHGLGHCPREHFAHDVGRDGVMHDGVQRQVVVVSAEWVFHFHTNGVNAEQCVEDDDAGHGRAPEQEGYESERQGRGPEHEEGAQVHDVAEGHLRFQDALARTQRVLQGRQICVKHGQLDAVDLARRVGPGEGLRERAQDAQDHVLGLLNLLDLPAREVDSQLREVAVAPEVLLGAHCVGH
mmetsp:Transcript_5374/g.14760  ORF Transcript_5374/g.14760 Transcript_5374/m.14760 type:complete len:212 (+) Transcript_5374:636-1271(+)